MKILIDTLTMTWKYNNIYTVIRQLGLITVDWQPLKLRRYDGGQYYDGVVIGWNYDRMGGIIDTYLEISGKGCRTVETINRERGFDWFKFLYQYNEDIWNKQVHIARIDVACDLEDGSITFKKLWKYAINGMYICRSKVLPDMRCQRTEIIYFGSEQSDRFLRIYNKALEQGIPDTDWMRFEFQLRNDNATSFYLNWCEHDLGELFSGMLIDYLRFVDIPKGWTKKQFIEAKDNRNQARFSTAKWWQEFVGSAERIKQLYLPGEEYTIERAERYLERNCASTMRTYMIAHDNSPQALEEKYKHAKLNMRQKALLKQLGKTVPSEYEYDT